MGPPPQSDSTELAEVLRRGRQRIKDGEKISRKADFLCRPVRPHYGGQVAPSPPFLRVDLVDLVDLVDGSRSVVRMSYLSGAGRLTWLLAIRGGGRSGRRSGAWLGGRRRR
jgi:hypothetical protein